MQSKYFECKDLVGGYGGADILHGCSVAIDKNEIVVIRHQRVFRLAIVKSKVDGAKTSCDIIAI